MAAGRRSLKCYQTDASISTENCIEVVEERCEICEERCEIYTKPPHVKNGHWVLSSLKKSQQKADDLLKLVRNKELLRFMDKRKGFSRSYVPDPNIFMVGRLEEKQYCELLKAILVSSQPEIRASFLDILTYKLIETSAEMTEYLPGGLLGILEICLMALEYDSKLMNANMATAQCLFELGFYKLSRTFGMASPYLYQMIESSVERFAGSNVKNSFDEVKYCTSKQRVKGLRTLYNEIKSMAKAHGFYGPMNALNFWCEYSTGISATIADIRNQNNFYFKRDMNLLEKKFGFDVRKSKDCHARIRLALLASQKNVKAVQLLRLGNKVAVSAAFELLNQALFMVNPYKDELCRFRLNLRLNRAATLFIAQSTGNFTFLHDFTTNALANDEKSLKFRYLEGVIEELSVRMNMGYCNDKTITWWRYCYKELGLKTIAFKDYETHRAKSLGENKRRPVF